MLWTARIQAQTERSCQRLRQFLISGRACRDQKPAPQPPTQFRLNRGSRSARVSKHQAARQQLRSKSILSSIWSSSTIHAGNMQASITTPPITISLGALTHARDRTQAAMPTNKTCPANHQPSFLTLLLPEPAEHTTSSNLSSTEILVRRVASGYPLVSLIENLD